MLHYIFIYRCSCLPQQIYQPILIMFVHGCFSQGHYRKALSSLHQMAAVQQLQPAQQSPTGQASLEHHRALIQQASCHYALGEYRVNICTPAHSFSVSGWCLSINIRALGYSGHGYYWLSVKKIAYILFYTFFLGWVMDYL